MNMESYKELTVKIRRFAILSMKGCYRSVKGHPFLVFVVLLLVFMYRSFPLLFSLLLSASPVLVCTAILLGTLLSFGQPNIPDIEEIEEKLRDEEIVVSRRAVVLEENETFVVERDASFGVERFVGEDKSVVEASSDRVPLIDEDSRERRAEDSEDESSNIRGRGFLEFEFEKNEIVEEEVKIEEGALSNERIVENHYSLVRDAEDQSGALLPDNDKEIGDSGDEAEEDDEDGSSYSDSDRAESSSPDASMADIIPMLDELHPLLDLDAPHPAHMSRDGSEHSHESDESSGESEGTENHRDEAEEDGVEDDHESHGGKEDESKSAIKWTEDDQKNLMDLGTSELERNLRLENLILRRRARKSFRLMAEKNLIDLESSDLSFNVPQISTKRSNPFDLPDDSYDHLGLPPIPGSAPSVLRLRRNPFDLPYDSNEEKPDLKGDSFENEFLPPHQREMMFRRHESFSLGSSSGMGGSRNDSRWKPVFVPHRLPSEEASFSLFQRQLSELSDSKMSSVPDTDSVSSVADADEKKLSDQDIHGPDLAEHESQSFEDEDTSERRRVHHDKDEIILGQAEDHHETDLDLSESRERSVDLGLDTGDIHVEAEPVEKERESSGSSLSSSSDSEEEERINDVVKDDHGQPDTSTIDLEAEALVVERDSFINESVNLSHEDSEFRSIGGAVDENENKEPVYDSSPHAADTQVELTSSSAEASSSVVSEEVRESTEINGANVAISEVCAESESQSESVVGESGLVLDSFHLTSLSPEVDTAEENSEENNSNEKSRMVALSDHISSEEQVPTVVEHARILSVSESEPLEFWEMVHEEMINADEHRAQSDSSSEICQNELIHPVKDEAETSSFDSEAARIESDHDSGSDLEALAPTRHHMSSDEERFPLAEEQVSVEEIDHEMEQEMVRSEPEQLHSETFSTIENKIQESESKEVLSSSDNEDTTIDKKSPIESKEQRPNMKAVSSSSVEESVASEERSPLKNETKEGSVLKVASSSSDDEKSTSKSEEELSSVVIPNEKGHHIELHEPCTVVDEAEVDSSTIVEEKALANFTINPSDSTGFPVGALEYEPHAGEIDRGDSILDGFVKEIDEVDEIKGIDEGLLYELDAVGDFGTKEVVSESSLHFVGVNEPEIIPELPVKVRSFEDIDLAFEQLRDEQTSVEESMTLHEKTSDVQIVDAESSLHSIRVTEPEIIPELPVLEVRSFEDIDLAFKKLRDERTASVEESTTLHEKTSDVQIVEAESSLGSIGVTEPEIVPELPVLEVRSFEDIDLALKQLRDKQTSMEESTTLHEKTSDVHIAEAESSLHSIGVTETEIVTELPVLEVRSFEDIDLAFKQLRDEQIDVEESMMLHEKTSDIQIFEAESSEETNVAPKRVSGNRVDGVELSLNSEIESAEREVESVKVESGVEEVNPVEDLKKSSPKKGEKKKSKDRLKKSGSSSSSTSSSSSSDSE